MPLYLDDFEPVGLPDAHLSALVQMALSAGDESVNPATAVRLIRGFVQPLLPEARRPLLDMKGQASWQRIHILYPKLVLESGQGEDKALLAAATLIHILVRHTTRPPREFQFPPFIELSSFRRICGYLRLPVAAPVVQVGQTSLDLYEFCKYCWQPAVARGVCRCHSTLVLPVAPAEPNPVCATATLKQAQRLRPEFDKRVLALVSADELQFHDSGFDAPVLLPPSGLRAWLTQYRPRLCRVIGEPRIASNSNALQDLLSALYGLMSAEVALTIGGAVYLLTPVTARAEGWLSAWESRPTWGGARRRGGKRAIQANHQRANQCSKVKP